MQHDHSFDPSRIDFRSVQPDRQAALIAGLVRRARRERDQAIGMAIGEALAWCWRLFWRFLKWAALRPAWISHVRKRREHIAAAQLRAMSDQDLADIGLSRSEIDNRVRFRTKPSRIRFAAEIGGK